MIAVQDIKRTAESSSAATVNVSEISIAEWKRKVNATEIYGIDKSGHLCEVKHKTTEDGKTIRMLFPLSNFTVIPIGETIEDNGVETNFTYDIIGILHNGQKLPQVQVAAESFPTMSWVSGAWGLKAVIEPGISKRDKVRHAAQLIAGDVPKKRIYMHTGWRKTEDGKYIYIHAGGAVGTDNISVRFKDKMDKYVLPNHCDELKESIESSLAFLYVADKEVTWPMIAMIGLAPLCEVLRSVGKEPAFILWIVGDSGARKSTLAALAMNHFGNFPDGTSHAASFKGTANSLEYKTFTAKDTILVVDDFHPYGSVQEEREMGAKAQQLFRSYGDKQGRSRLKSDGTPRATYIPKGLCVVTGEDVPKGPLSGHARYLAVPIDKDSVDLEALTIMQEKAHLFGQTMVGYLEWLSPTMEDRGEEWKQTLNAVREDVQKGPMHGRTHEAVAALYLGAKTFLEFACHHGVIDQEKKQQYLNEAYDIFRDLAKRHAAQMLKESPVNQFLNAIRELLVSEKAYISSLSVDSEDDIERGDKLGYYDDNYYYLLPDATINAITQFYQKQNRSFPVTKDTLLKQLEKNNLIFVKIRNDGNIQRTPQKKVRGKVGSYIWLNRSALVLEDER